MRHRIYVVPMRQDVQRRAAVAHWQRGHAELFCRTPGLRAYVQNRPAANDPHHGTLVCSETWFLDARAEREAYASAFYTGSVTQDEARFVVRDRAWTAVVLTEGAPPQRASPWRALVIGWSGEVLPQGREVRVLDLDRPAPDGGPARLLSVRGDTYGSIRPALDEPGDLVLVTKPASFALSS